MRGAETLEDKIPESTWALSQRIIAMAWPNILYAILDRGLGLVDMWLAGSLDQAAVGSIGLSQKIMILVLIITISFTAGAMPIMGQAFGSKDLGRVRHAANQTLKAMLFSSLIIALILYLIADPAFRALKASDSVRDYGVTYLQCLVFGLPLMFLNYTIVILFRSIGYVKTPLVILVFVQVVNVLVSYFLLHGIDGLIEPMGVRGLAIGTIAARGVGAFLGIAVWFYLIRHYPGDKSPQLFDWKMLKNILRIGFPIGSMNLIRVMAQVVFISFFAAGSDIALAAASRADQLRMMLIMPGLMIQQALITLVSHSLGADDPQTAKRLTWQTQLYGTIFLGSITLAVFGFAPQIMALLGEGDTVNKDAVASAGVDMIRIFIWGQFFVTIAMVFSGALTAGGDVRIPLLYTFIAEWCVMLPSAYIIRHLYPENIEYIWFSFILSPMVLAAFYFWRYGQEKWIRRI